MYYICKLSDSWSLLDSQRSTSRFLEKSEVEALRKIFPRLFEEDTILSYIEVSSVHPNKLMKMTKPNDKRSEKKSPGSANLITSSTAG